MYMNLGSQKSKDSAGCHVEPDNKATQVREELTSGDESSQDNTVWALSLVSFKIIFFLTYASKISFYKACLCFLSLVSNGYCLTVAGSEDEEEKKCLEN